MAAVLDAQARSAPALTGSSAAVFTPLLRQDGTTDKVLLPASFLEQYTLKGVIGTGLTSTVVAVRCVVCGVHPSRRLAITCVTFATRPSENPPASHAPQRSSKKASWSPACCSAFKAKCAS